MGAYTGASKWSGKRHLELRPAGDELSWPVWEGGRSLVPGRAGTRALRQEPVRLLQRTATTVSGPEPRGEGGECHM